VTLSTSVSVFVSVPTPMPVSVSMSVSALQQLQSGKSVAAAARILEHFGFVCVRVCMCGCVHVLQVSGCSYADS